MAAAPRLVGDVQPGGCGRATPGTASEPVSAALHRGGSLLPALSGRVGVHGQGRTSSDGSRSLPPQTR
jgi:hypothetical protein